MTTTELGICSVTADMTAKAAIGPAWAAAVRALSPRLTYVRTSFGADAAGNVSVSLLRKGLAAWRDAGLEVIPVLEGSLARPGLAQNDVLGWKGDPLKSPWIDSYTNNVIALLGALGDLCPRRVWLLNEGNVQAAADPQGDGHVIPQLLMGETPDPAKPEAMAPQVFWSAMQHAGYWLKKERVGVKTVYPGALSLDLAFLTGLEDNWIGGYLGTGIAYLAAHGVKAPFAFDGLSLNTEGLCSPAYGAYLREGLAALKSRMGISGPTIIGEWGVPNAAGGAPLGVGTMQATGAQLASLAAGMSWFSAHPVGGYGALRLAYQDGEIVPAGPLAWAALLPGLLASIEGG